MEDRRWKVAFIPPDLWDLMKDYVFAKGDTDRVYSPKVLVIRAVEDYLSKRGYQAQVEELREATKQKRSVRIFSEEKFSEEQKESVRLLMKYEGLDKQQAIKWVLDHPEVVKDVARA